MIVIYYGILMKHTITYQTFMGNWYALQNKTFILSVSLWSIMGFSHPFLHMGANFGGKKTQLLRSYRFLKISHYRLCRVRRDLKSLEKSAFFCIFWKSLEKSGFLNDFLISVWKSLENWFGNHMIFFIPFFAWHL